MHTINYNTTFRHNLALAVILLLALSLRLWLTVEIIGLNQPALTSDDREFEAIGWTLASVGRYAEQAHEPPTARRSPVMPLFIAAMYSVVGHQPAFAQMVLVLISVVAVALTYRLGAMLGGNSVGLLAATVLALDPFAWIFSGVFYSETLFLALLLAAMLLFFKTLRDPRYAVALGIALGLCALTRPNGLLLAGMMGLLLPFFNRRLVKQAAMVLALVAVMLLPWVARNWLTFEEIILGTAQSGEVLAGVYNQTCLDFRCNEWVSPYMLPEFEAYDLRSLDEMTRNDILTAYALDTIRAEPQAWASLAPTKVIRFWSHDAIFPNTDYRREPPQALWRYQQLFYRGLFVTAVVGLFTFFFTQQRESFITLMAVVALFSLMALLIWGDARLRLPLHPLLAVASAYALVVAGRKVRERWR